MIMYFLKLKLEKFNFGTKLKYLIISKRRKYCAREKFNKEQVV